MPIDCYLSRILTVRSETLRTSAGKSLTARMHVRRGTCVSSRMNFAAKKTIQDVVVLNQGTKGTTEDYKHVIDSDVKIGLGDQNDFHGNIKIK